MLFRSEGSAQRAKRRCLPNQVKSVTDNDHGTVSTDRTTHRTMVRLACLDQYINPKPMEKRREPDQQPSHENPPNPSLQKVSGGGTRRRESISINSNIVKATASISIIITTIYIYVIASPSHLVVILEHLVVDLHVHSFIHSSSIHNINTMMFIAFMCE